MKVLVCLSVLVCGVSFQAQDVDQVLEKAEKLLEEAKSLYESAKAKASVEGLTEAGFKLEEAKIKYLAVQELTQGEKQKLAQDRLKVIGQLVKLIHDGKVAITGKSVEEPPPPAEPAAAPKQAAVVAPAPAAPRRSPVPEAAKQKEAEKTIRDLFKVEYAKKQPAERLAFAKKLLQQGKDTRDDAAAQWVFFREAQEIAAQSADAETALEAVQAMSVTFEIESLPAKTAALAAVAKAARTPEEAGRLAEQYLKLADEAVVTDDYDAAEKALAAAGQSAKRAAQVALSLRTATRTREIGELKARFEKVKKAYETVGRNPADPAANFEIGQFQCFVKGDWDVGLSFLAKGSDAALSALAAKELSNPSEPERQLEIADGWWDLAEKEKGERQRRMTLRAIQGYEKSVPGLNGLQKAKGLARIDLVHKRALAQGLDVVLGSKVASRGVRLCENDDGRYEMTVMAGKPCDRFIHPYLYFDVMETWQDSWRPVEIDVEYYDDGGGAFDLQYDAVSGIYKGAGKQVSVGSSKTWKVATFSIPDPAFLGRLNASSDFRICRGPGGNFYVTRIAVRLILK
jgi:hypothetical protein